MTIPPTLPKSDREALALAAWHALLSSGTAYGSPTATAEDAFVHADAMLRQIEEQRERGK